MNSIKNENFLRDQPHFNIGEDVEMMAHKKRKSVAMKITRVDTDKVKNLLELR